MLPTSVTIAPGASGSDGFENVLEQKHRRAEDDEVGVVDGHRQIVGRFINGPDFDGFVEGRPAMAITDDVKREVVGLDGQPDRATQQAHAQNADPAGLHQRKLLAQGG